MSIQIPVELPSSASCYQFTAVNIYCSDEQLCNYRFVGQKPIDCNTTEVTYDGDQICTWARLGFVAIDPDNPTAGPQELCLSMPMRVGDPCQLQFNKRISARKCNTVKLDSYFYRNGQRQDPYALRSVKIYKTSVEDSNLIMEIPISDLNSTDYPFPIEKAGVGHYNLYLDIPNDWDTPNIYFDVWCFITDPNCINGDFHVDDESHWECQCNRFWVYPDGWFVDDKLITPRFQFEPLDVKFRAGETRYLEVGVMPLPLYDYDYNLIAPMIPYMCALITIETRNKEKIVEAEVMEMGLRHGSYRSNPFVFKYLLETSKFLKGTYNYHITVRLPDGQTLVSPEYTLTIY